MGSQISVMEPSQYVTESQNIFYLSVYLSIYLFIYLSVLGLHCCAWDFFSCGKWGLLFIAVHRLLVAVASLVVERGL